LFSDRQAYRILMKYILILYVCTFATTEPVCNGSYVIGEYMNWKTCTLEGYKHSYVYLNDFHLDDMEDKKIAMKFYCKEMGVA